VNAVQRELAVTDAGRRADFIRRLIGGAITPAALTSEGRLLQLDPRQPYHVACTAWADTSSCSDLAAALRARGATRDSPVVDAVIDGQLVALLPRKPDGVDTTQPVGIGPQVVLGAVSGSYHQARRALSIAAHHGRAGLVDLSSLGPLPLLENSDDAAELLEAKHLEPLSHHGRAGDEILTTVTAYLDHDRKVDDTARDLFVHRNTIRYRLTRFAEITGLDIDRTEDMIL